MLCKFLSEQTEIKQTDKLSFSDPIYARENWIDQERDQSSLGSIPSFAGVYTGSIQVWNISSFFSFLPVPIHFQVLLLRIFFHEIVYSMNKEIDLEQV